MPKHNETGQEGEVIAVDYLLKKGYLLLYRNWRCGHKEIDCILRDGDQAVFVEIKTRAGSAFGFPEEFVNERKKSLMRQAAAVFLETHPDIAALRFDIVSILGDTRGSYEIRHLIDAFY